MGSCLCQSIPLLHGQPDLLLQIRPAESPAAMQRSSWQGPFLEKLWLVRKATPDHGNERIPLLATQVLVLYKLQELPKKYRVYFFHASLQMGGFRGK